MRLTAYHIWQENNDDDDDDDDNHSRCELCLTHNSSKQTIGICIFETREKNWRGFDTVWTSYLMILRNSYQLKCHLLSAWVCMCVCVCVYVCVCVCTLPLPVRKLHWWNTSGKNWKKKKWEEDEWNKTNKLSKVGQRTRGCFLHV